MHISFISHAFSQRNTFQMVVVTDELFSFTIFNYAKLTWVTGDASQGSGGFGGTAAMVGINAGDGVNFKKFKYSLTDRVVEVLNDTNMRDCIMDTLKGQYVYQIDTVPAFDAENCKDATKRPSFNPCLPGRLTAVKKIFTFNSSFTFCCHLVSTCMHVMTLQADKYILHSMPGTHSD